jgi:ribosomal protein S18 acetylase RimI-like enzyme
VENGTGRTNVLSSGLAAREREGEVKNTMTNSILPRNASSAELAAAVQENLFDLFRAMMVLPGGELVEEGGVSYHHTFPTNPMFKGIWRTRLTPDETDAAIEERLAWYKARNAPYNFWWIGPGSEPADLPERLLRHGFHPNVEGDPGLGVDLHQLNEAVKTPAGFKIEQVTSQQGLEDWRDVFAASFDIPLFAGQAWVDATLAAGGERAPWQLYVGYLNGRPVATNILFNGGGAAGLYGIGTLPEARNQGIGAAITLKPLLDARDQGYHVGVLFATPMGLPVYRRLGFREVDCRIGRLIWYNQ